MMNLQENMNEQIAYRYDGYTFDEWYNAHNSRYRMVYWVKYGDKEEMRKLYEALPSTPKVGDPATKILWSDTYGCTIVEVETKKDGTPKRVGVRHNEYTIKDYYDGHGTCTDELKGDVEYYTLRRNKRWVQEGQKSNRGSVVLAIGYRRTYRDPSF